MHGIRIERGNGGIYNFLVNITYAAFCKLAFSIDEFKIKLNTVCLYHIHLIGIYFMVE